MVPTDKLREARYEIASYLGNATRFVKAEARRDRIIGLKRAVKERTRLLRILQGALKHCDVAMNELLKFNRSMR